MGLFSTSDPDAKQDKRLAKLRKKAQKASKRAAEESREARGPRPSAPAPAEDKDESEPNTDAAENDAHLSKKEQKRLAKLRKKARKGA